MAVDRIPSSESEREAQLRRTILRGVWLMTIGFVIVYFSGSFAPLVAYGLIIAGAVLIGHGGNLVIRPLFLEGLRLRRQ